MEFGAELLEKFESYFGRTVTKVVLLTLVFSGCLAALGVAFTPTFELFRGLLSDKPEAYRLVSDLILYGQIFLIVALLALAVTLRQQISSSERDFNELKDQRETEHQESQREFYRLLEEHRRESKELHDQAAYLINDVRSSLPDSPEKQELIENMERLQEGLRKTGFYQKAPKATWPPR